MITCIAVASHIDDKPDIGSVRGFLVHFFVKRLSSSVWLRVGMGQITEAFCLRTLHQQISQFYNLNVSV